MGKTGQVSFWVKVFLYRKSQFWSIFLGLGKKYHRDTGVVGASEAGVVGSQRSWGCWGSRREVGGVVEGRGWGWGVREGNDQLNKVQKSLSVEH